MSQKSTKPVERDDGNVGMQKLDTGDVVLATSSRGKPITITKIENPTQIEKESKADTIDLRAFKNCPIEYLHEASQREYEVEGDEDEIELEYDEMTESDD